MALEPFQKLPLGGIDRRGLVKVMASDGRRVADELLARDRAGIERRGTAIPDDVAVVILGGSNGITRALALQLLFGERAAVFGVHYDSERLQIGHHHVQALVAAAEAEGLRARFWNADATRPETIEEVATAIAADFRAVHLVNGVAAGATKRYAEHGPIQVPDLDQAFDPVLQVPDFTRRESYRKLGLVDVEVATDADIERTDRFMGTSSVLWAEGLASAGLLAAGESIVTFCDYDFPPDDPVYAMGPLAGAKKRHRESLVEITQRFGARTARLCYPAMPTTALGAIPGGCLMYALSAEILAERGELQTLPELAAGSMPLFGPEWDGEELRLDAAYQRCLPEFHERQATLDPGDVPEAFARLLA